MMYRENGLGDLLMHIRMFDLRVKDKKIRKDLKNSFNKILDHECFFWTGAI